MSMVASRANHTPTMMTRRTKRPGIATVSFGSTDTPLPNRGPEESMPDCLGSNGKSGLAVRPTVNESVIIDTVDVNDLDYAVIECDVGSLSGVRTGGQPRLPSRSSFKLRSPPPQLTQSNHLAVIARAVLIVLVIPTVFSSDCFAIFALVREPSQVNQEVGQTTA